MKQPIGRINLTDRRFRLMKDAPNMRHNWNRYLKTNNQEEIQTIVATRDRIKAKAIEQDDLAFFEVKWQEYMNRYGIVIPD